MKFDVKRAELRMFYNISMLSYHQCIAMGPLKNCVFSIFYPLTPLVDKFTT